MGVDLTSLHVCHVVASVRGLGRVVTLGRQGVHLGHRDLMEAGWPASEQAPQYAETLLLKLFGVSDCESLDASAYEGASLIADLNEPLPAALCGQFDTVLDFGTLEHVFDVRSSFTNASALCREGGAIAHVLPVNQYCGHGFYQFSPEFYYSYYSPSRGYSHTTVYLVETANPREWYHVPRPGLGQRINVSSIGPLYGVCLTVKTSEMSGGVPQQSDYETLWSGQIAGVEPPTRRGARATLRAAVKRVPGASRAYRAVRGPVRVNADVALRRLSAKSVTWP